MNLVNDCVVPMPAYQIFPLTGYSFEESLTRQSHVYQNFEYDPIRTRKSLNRHRYFNILSYRGGKFTAMIFYCF